MPNLRALFAKFWKPFKFGRLDEGVHIEIINADYNLPCYGFAYNMATKYYFEFGHYFRREWHIKQEYKENE